MATIQVIETPYGSGHSNREIAVLLDIDRGTINNFVQRLKAETAARNATDPTAGDAQDRPNAR